MGSRKELGNECGVEKLFRSSSKAYRKARSIADTILDLVNLQLDPEL